MQTLTSLTLNTHLMGELGLIGDRKTRLYFHDEQRASEIMARLQRSPDDVVGLTEVWDQRLGQGIIEGVRDVFPHHVYAPCANGISDVLAYLRDNVFRRWPRGSDYLMERAEGIVDHIVQEIHYKVGRRSNFSALRVFVPEDLIMRSLSRAFSEPLFWGAGLLLLSRHPIDHAETEFLPFQARADLERFAGKGILKAVVRPAGATPVTVLLTHYQEGLSPHAMEARKRQIQQTGTQVKSSLYPVIAMGDMNIDAETPEYRRMILELGLSDVYRQIHPDREAKPGYTYDHQNPYAERLGVTSAHRNDGQKERQRIDYHLASPLLRVLSAEVLVEPFMSDSGDFYLSDHLAVRAALALHP